MTALTSHTIDVIHNNGYGRCAVTSVWISQLYLSGEIIFFPPIIMSYSLTVREKEHWKDRFSTRIDERIDVLSAEKSSFMVAVHKKARDRVLESAGILKMQQKVDEINKKSALLDDKSSKLLDEVDMKKRAVDEKIQPLLDKAHKEIVELQKQSKKKRSLIDEQFQLSIDETEKLRELQTVRKLKVLRKMIAKVENIPLREVGEYPYNPEGDIGNALYSDVQTEIDNVLAESDRGLQILALRTEKENLLDTVWLATSGKQIKELWETVNSLLGNSQTNLQCQVADIPPVEEE